jgi:hypothetical protein
MDEIENIRLQVQQLNGKVHRLVEDLSRLEQSYDNMVLWLRTVGITMETNIVESDLDDIPVCNLNDVPAEAWK